MSDELGTRGRSNWSLGWVLLLGAAGCATSGAETDRSAAAGDVTGERTQQVVQRVMPADGTAAQGAARAESAVSGSEGLAPVSSRESRSARRADAISSKHLEAELNRLEAELGR